MTVSSRIHPLPLHLANQIAAGEVIERPASVVKELVENSIDANATQIDIDIDGAGSKLIRVRDNGLGIHADDLPLALSRHATSKLHSSEQLSHIDSLGFRGEALPSISSVSQLTLTSRQQDSDCAWQLTSEDENVSPASHALGTTIEVRDLFFNLPARRRFLRSNKTEQNHILTTLYRLALSRFDIGFSCQISASNRLKLPISTSNTTHQQRIAKICGQAFIKEALYIEQTFDDISLSGWLAKPSAHRPQTDIQYFFINGRVIRDRVINHAVRQAYAEQIPAGRHAAYVLYLSLPLDRVDVNVHPTKHEVRFRDARLIHGLITSAIQDALSEDSIVENEVLRDDNQNMSIAEQGEHYSVEKKSTVSTKGSPLPKVSIETSHTLLAQRYLLAHINQQAMLIDVQRADQHLRRQSLVQAIQNNTLKSRPILVPITVPTTQDNIELYINHAEELNRFGIAFKIQDQGLEVKQIPSLLAQINIQEFATEILNALSEGQTSFEQLSELLPRLVPFGLITSLEQAKQVITQLDDQLNDHRWCKQLDQQTLSSLFSS